MIIEAGEPNIVLQIKAEQIHSKSYLNWIQGAIRETHLGNKFEAQTGRERVFEIGSVIPVRDIVLIEVD